MSGFQPKTHIMDLVAGDQISIPNFRGAIDFRTARSNASREDKIIAGGAHVDTLIYIRLSLGTEGDTIPIRTGEQFRLIKDEGIDGVTIFRAPTEVYPAVDPGKGVFAMIVESDPEAYEIIR